MRADKIFIIMILAAAVLFLSASVHYYHKTVQDGASLNYVDFRVYYYAGARLEAKADIYNPDDGYFVYKYSPIFALFMSMFRFLTANPAQALLAWYLILFLSFVISIYFTRRLLFYTDGPRPKSVLFDIVPVMFILRYLVLINFIPYMPKDWPLVLRIFDILLYASGIIFILSLGFARNPETGKNSTQLKIMGIAVLALLGSVILNIDRAQVNLVILVLLSFFAYYLVNKKEKLAGVYLAIAGAIKLFPLIFILYLVLKRNLKAAFSTLIVFFVLIFMPAFKWGFERNLALLKGWLGVLFSTIPAEYLSFKNHSLFAFISRYFSKNSGLALLGLDEIRLRALVIAAYGIFTAVLTYCTIVKRPRAEKTYLYDLSLFFISMVLLSPVGTKTTFVYALLPLAALAKEVFDRRFKDRFLNLGLTLYISLNFINSEDVIGKLSLTMNNLSAPTFGLFLLFGLIVYSKLTSGFSLTSTWGQHLRKVG